RRELVKGYPAIPQYWSELASTRNNLGVLLADLGQGAEAEKAYREAAEIRRGLVREFPNVPAYAVELGGTYCNLANLISARGQSAASLVWYEEAASTLEPVVRKDPSGVYARQFVRNTCVGRAMALEKLSRYDEALLCWDRALDLAEASAPLSFRI